VLDLADVVTSTSGMLRFPAGDDAREYIVATETGLLHRLHQDYPDRRFVAATLNAVCPNMKLTTLEKAIEALDEGLNEIVVPPRISERAARAVARMVA
jgi:quinolinate synthase